jgi:hypothetical protein
VFGRVTADAAPGQAGDPAEILFPPALLRRAARYIGGAADLAANGGKLPDGDSRDGTQPAGRDRPGRGHRALPLQHPAQVAARDEAHRDKQHPIRLAGLIDRDDVRSSTAAAARDSALNRRRKAA